MIFDYWTHTEQGRKSIANAKTAYDLYSSGKSYDEIALESGIKKSSAIERVKRYERWMRGYPYKQNKEEAPALPECPICRKFHEHDHGGLDVLP